MATNQNGHGFCRLPLHSTRQRTVGRAGAHRDARQRKCLHAVTLLKSENPSAEPAPPTSDLATSTTRPPSSSQPRASGGSSSETSPLQQQVETRCRTHPDRQSRGTSRRRTTCHREYHSNFPISLGNGQLCSLPCQQTNGGVALLPPRPFGPYGTPEAETESLTCRSSKEIGQHLQTCRQNKSHRMTYKKNLLSSTKSDTVLSVTAKPLSRSLCPQSSI